MSVATKGNTVKVHYTGKLKDGTIFDSSQDREPLEFVLGDGKMIKGFDVAVEGMKVGDDKSVHIDDTKITLDANHPLAGEDLVFEIKLVEVV